MDNKTHNLIPHTFVTLILGPEQTNVRPGASYSAGAHLLIFLQKIKHFQPAPFNIFYLLYLNAYLDKYLLFLILSYTQSTKY